MVTFYQMSVNCGSVVVDKDYVKQFSTVSPGSDQNKGPFFPKIEKLNVIYYINFFNLIFLTIK